MVIHNINLPKAVSDLPKAVSDLPKAVSDLPKAVSDLPKAVSDLPKAVSDLQMENNLYYIIETDTKNTEIFTGLCSKGLRLKVLRQYENDVKHLPSCLITVCDDISNPFPPYDQMDLVICCENTPPVSEAICSQNRQFDIYLKKKHNCFSGSYIRKESGIMLCVTDVSVSRCRRKMLLELEFIAHCSRLSQNEFPNKILTSTVFNYRSHNKYSIALNQATCAEVNKSKYVLKNRMYDDVWKYFMFLPQIIGLKDIVTHILDIIFKYFEWNILLQDINRHCSKKIIVNCYLDETFYSIDHPDDNYHLDDNYNEKKHIDYIYNN